MGQPRALVLLGQHRVKPGSQDRTATFLGERHGRIARRRGKAKAQVAVARSILVIIWHLLADPGARFTDLATIPTARASSWPTGARSSAWSRKTQERGLTLVPTRIYFSGPRAKVEIALGRGKDRFDKRESMKSRDQQRDIERAISERY